MNIILFDMDNTLVSADTGDLWGEFLDLKGITHQKDKIIRRKLGKDYEEGTLDAIENFHFELSLLNKIPVFQRESLRDDFFEKFVKTQNF